MLWLYEYINLKTCMQLQKKKKYIAQMLTGESTTSYFSSST